MREPKDFDIDWEGRRCIVNELGAMPARQVARRITNVVGTAVREGASGIDKDVQVAGLMATGAILERLDDGTLDWLTQTFYKQTTVETEPGSETFIPMRDVSELVFGGGDGLARWMRWLSFCLEMTCADFFRAAFAEFQRMQTTAKAGTSKAMSTKPNGVSSGATPSPDISSRAGNFTG